MRDNNIWRPNGETITKDEIMKLEKKHPAEAIGYFLDEGDHLTLSNISGYHAKAAYHQMDDMYGLLEGRMTAEKKKMLKIALAAAMGHCEDIMRLGNVMMFHTKEIVD